MSSTTVQSSRSSIVILSKALFTFVVAFAAVFSLGLGVSGLLSAVLNMFIGDFSSVVYGLIAFMVSAAIIAPTYYLFTKYSQ